MENPFFIIFLPNYLLNQNSREGRKSRVPRSSGEILILHWGSLGLLLCGMSSRRGFSLPTFPEGHMYSSSLCIHSRAKLTSSNSATRMECQGSSSWLLWTLSQLLPVHSAALLSKQGQRASCRLQTKYMFRAFLPLLKPSLLLLLLGHDSCLPQASVIVHPFPGSLSLPPDFTWFFLRIYSDVLFKGHLLRLSFLTTTSKMLLLPKACHSYSLTLP